MTRKNESPQKVAMREMMHNYLKNNDINIKNGVDVNAVMRDKINSNYVIYVKIFFTPKYKVEVISIKIILTECDTGNFMTFPMLPEEIKVDCATRFQSYDIMNIGEVMQPLGEELTRISWSCKIPGEKRQVKKENGGYQNPYIIVSHGDPLKVQSWFSFLRNRGIKCRLLITETPVNHEVYLESYTMTYAGGFGDYDCDISFVHAKDLKVSTEGNENNSEDGTTKAVTPQQQQRPEKKTDGSYTVKKGDCLWDIAQAKLGAGNRYQEIATLNNISNPNKISVGQVLLLPT